MFIKTKQGGGEMLAGKAPPKIAGVSHIILGGTPRKHLTLFLSITRDTLQYNTIILYSSDQEITVPIDTYNTIKAKP